MIANRGTTNWKDIRIANMNELGKIGRCGLEERLLNKSNVIYYNGV